MENEGNSAMKHGKENYNGYTVLVRTLIFQRRAFSTTLDISFSQYQSFVATWECY